MIAITIVIINGIKVKIVSMRLITWMKNSLSFLIKQVTYMALRGPFVGTSIEFFGPWDALAPLGEVLMDGEYVSSLTVEILLANVSPPLDPWVFNRRMLRFLALKIFFKLSNHI